MAVMIGAGSAVSFQTRLNGLLALGGAGIVLIAVAFRRRDGRALVLPLIATITCATVALLSNPYYWAEPRPAPQLAAQYLEHEQLPARVVSRVRTQLAELHTLLEQHAYAELRWPTDRCRFVAGVLFSGSAGLLLLGGFAAALILLLGRRQWSVLLFPALWGMPVNGVFALWLPLAWDAYVIMIFPSAVLLAATACHALALTAAN
jgi:4-amino-4-deoxy-L-arabinose transferase-like glycosyltransferase